MTLLRIVLITVGGLVAAFIVFVVVVVILVLVGGPDIDAGCGDRQIGTVGQSAAAFDDKWDAFDERVGGGQASVVEFVEPELTQRAREFLFEQGVDELRDVTICLFADGTGEARGEVDVPVLPDISATIRGSIDLSGPFPVLTIEDLDVGSAGFLIDAFGAKDEVEDAINEALREVDLTNPAYRVEVREGSVTISGG